MRVACASSAQASRPCPCRTAGNTGSNTALRPGPPKHAHGGCSGACSGCPSNKGGAAAAGKPAHVGGAGRKGVAPPPEALGIFYSSATGKTQDIAGRIKETLGDAANEPLDISDVPDLTAALTDPALDGLIVGAPTWNTGADKGRSGTAWDDVLGQIAGMDLKGRKCAVYGLGDQVSYGDYYCDSIEELHTTFSAAGCTMVGTVSTEGYEHSESKAETQPGMFCGLPLDEDTQDHLTDGRIAAWTAQVLAEMGLAAHV